MIAESTISGKIRHDSMVSPLRELGSDFFSPVFVVTGSFDRKDAGFFSVRNERDDVPPGNNHL
jgi:hypothetical protein